MQRMSLPLCLDVCIKNGMGPVSVSSEGVKETICLII